MNTEVLARPRRATSRLLALILITLIHLGLYHAAVRSRATAPRGGDTGAASYIAFAFLPKPVVAIAQPVVAPVARPQPAQVKRARPLLPRHGAVPAPVMVADESDAGAAQATHSPQETPAPAAAPAALDIGELRAMARRLAREHVPTPLDRVRAAESYRALDDSNVARAVKKAVRPDCRTAYGGGEKFNVLALIPLAIDTVTDTGCKW